MRFISMHDGLMVQVRPQIQESYATGTTRVLQEQILADFRAEDVRPHERALAIAQFSFRGLYQEQDEVTTVAPDYRIGLFDTVAAQRDRGWPDDTRQEVERVLTEIAERFEHILVAPRTSVPPPWPRYDSYRGTTQKLIQKLVGEGHDLGQVLIYERENQQRENVIEALEEAIENPELQEARELEEEVVG